MKQWRPGMGDRGRGTRKAGRVPRPMSHVPHLIALALLIALGCAAITTSLPVLQHAPRPDQRPQPPTVTEAHGYADYTGVLHVHTTYSHDAHGLFSDVVRVTNAQHIDFATITDHNTLAALRDGLQGWHGETLVLVGEELSTRSGHYLALNVHEEVDKDKRSTQQVIDDVNRQGGLGFIAHPFFKTARWRDWTVTGFTGIEGYNVAHDTLDENKVRLALWTLTVPAEPFYYSILDRPYDPLATWDRLISERGHITGIGSTDAHEFHAMGLKFAPYEIMFQLARTHVLIPSRTLTDAGIYDALRRGHAYFSIELVAQAKGFMFSAMDGNTLAGIMGDDVTLTDHLTLNASLPTAAQLTLFHDGRAIASKTGASWQVPVTAPGAYRLEAARHGKPWIFSNPIYVRPQNVPSTSQTLPPEPTSDRAS